MKRTFLRIIIYVRKNIRLLLMLKKYPKAFKFRYIGSISDAMLKRLYSNIDTKFEYWILIGENYALEATGECEILDLAPGFLAAHSDGNIQMLSGGEFEDILPHFKEVGNMIKQRNKKNLPYFLGFGAVFAALSLISPFFILVPLVLSLLFLFFLVC